MKRIISIILVVVTLLTTMLSLTGCGATTADSALSMGQWVTLIADSFGMQNYVTEEPYFKNVKSDNSYFAVFQMAAEWDILAPSDVISVSTPVTWKDAWITLVNAGGFLDINATDEEKVDFAVSNFGDDIRKYWSNRYIKLSQAVEMLDVAQALWTKKVIETPVEEAVFTEKVKNYLDDEIQYSIEDGKVKVLSSQIDDLKAGDVFALPCNSANSAMLKKVVDVSYIGDYAYIEHEDIPDDELSQYAESVVVRDTTVVDFSQITGIYDEHGNLIVPDTYDSVDAEEMNFSSQEPIAQNLSCTSSLLEKDSGIQTLGLNSKTTTDAKIVNTGLFDKASGKFTFNAGGYKVTLNLSGESFGVQLSKDSNKKTNQTRDTKTTSYIGAECKWIELTKEIDISWGKIKSALVKIDYETTITGGVKTTTNNKVGKQDGDGSEVKSSLKSIVSGYKTALSQIKSSVNETKYVNDSVYICRINLVPTGFASVDFIVKGVVSVTGEMKIVIELEGCQGIEYKNGKVRYINSKGVDTNFVAEGKVEATISPGFAITILSKWSLGEILFDIGAGVSGSFTAHLIDVEGHKIYSEAGATLSTEDIVDLEATTSFVSSEELLAFAQDSGGDWIGYTQGRSVELVKGFCFEWKLYPIIRLSMGDGLLPNLLKSAQVSLTYEFLGKKNVTLSGHLDFGPQNSASYIQASLKADVLDVDIKKTLGIGEKCSFDFVPWDSVEDEFPLGEEDASIDTSDILTTDGIILSSMRITLNAGESQYITITGLPAGYTIEDVIAKSDDKDIATIDIRYGKVTAQKKTGTTQIVVMTEDEKYKAYFAVTVVDDEKVGFDGLK